MNYKIDYLANKINFLDEVPLLWTTQWPKSYPKETIYYDTNRMLNVDQLPFILVAHKQDELIGTLALVPNLLKSSPELAPWVGCVFVKPEHRLQGVASKLLSQVRLEAKRLGYKKIYLHTEKTQKLYEKNGWKFLQHTIDDIGDPTDIYFFDI